MISSFRARTFFAGVLWAVAVVSMTGDPATAADKQKLNATRDQVAAACDANGGFQWGTGSDSGRYGCMTDNAWVECDADGNCEGGQASSTAGRRTALAGNNKLLQSIE